MARFWRHDIKVMSVFAEPRRIIDKDEATELDHRRAAGRQRQRIARKARLAQGLHLDQARRHAGAAAGDLPARPARRRLHARKQARLSQWAARRRMCSASPIPTTTALPGIEKYLDGQGLADLHDAGFNLAPENLEADRPVARHARDPCGARRTGPRHGAFSGQGGGGGHSRSEHRRSHRGSLAAGLRPQQSDRRAQVQQHQPIDGRRL